MTSINKHKLFFKNFSWSIAALIVVNGITQFCLYPILRKLLGAEEYGNVLFLIGILNVIAISIGISVNNSRLKHITTQYIAPKKYERLLSAIFVLTLPIALISLLLTGKPVSLLDVLLYWILMCSTTYRYYADVEYRISLNYHGYFKYYFIISIGYVLGIGAYYFLEHWQLILLTGELAGCAYVQMEKKKNISFTLEPNTYEADKQEEHYKFIIKSVIFLLIAQILVNVVLNADRILLKTIVNGTAVTIYYVASLAGKMLALISSPFNNVLIGHLSKEDGTMSSKQYFKICILLFCISCLVLCAAIMASIVFVYIFYPQEYQTAKAYFFIANTAQVMYFSTGILNTVLLRYINEKYQMYMNIIYISFFLLIAIPGTLYGGLTGFAYTIAFINILRFLISIFIGSVVLKGQEN